MPNRLVNEKSPYLLQHADNPVEWYPWGDEAFSRARAEDRPLLVSIGYSACHWCHVMAHESFEDEETAALMNQWFVNVKVDREERPDVDAIYMEAVQGMTGQGGWPLNVFLTPQGDPFFGGTYFPPRPGHGIPSWTQVLESLAAAYRERREDVAVNAERVAAYVRQAQSIGSGAGEIPRTLVQDAYRVALQQFDWENGGFGGAPKFPQPLGIEYVLRMAGRGDSTARRFAELTLRKMAQGGIFDHLGGGFHRYTVDAQWTVPHFEKMLYDNALLARVYLQAFQLTRDPFYRKIVERTLDYLLRDMRSPQGGFYSAQDADSEGEEGRYYVWTPEQISSVLDAQGAEAVVARYGVREHGNFEGKTILTAARSVKDVATSLHLSVEETSAVLHDATWTLLQARSRRIAPGTDTKILTSWNALALRAFAEAGAVLDRSDYVDAAGDAALFLLHSMRPDGRLVRSFKDGPSSIGAFLEDYAFLVEALISVYETTADPAFYESALELAEEMIARFSDAEGQTFYDTASGGAELIVRPRSLYDNPIPAGNSSAAFALLRLKALSGETRYGEIARSTLRAVGEIAARAPLAFAYWLCAIDFSQSGALQIAIAGERQDTTTRNMLGAVYRRYLPNTVVAVGTSESVPLLGGRTHAAETTAYVCREFTCHLPVTEVDALARQLDDASSSVR